MAIPCKNEKKINDKEESINNGDVKKNLFLVLISKNICKNILPINEVYLGTDGKSYKNVYYVTMDIDEKNFEKLNNNEVSCIKWTTYLEAVKLLRPYYNSKKRILNNMMMFLINLTIFDDNNDILLG